MFLKSAVRKVEQMLDVTFEAKTRGSIFVFEATKTIGKEGGVHHRDREEVGILELVRGM